MDNDNVPFAMYPDPDAEADFIADHVPAKVFFKLAACPTAPRAPLEALGQALASS